IRMLEHVVHKDRPSKRDVVGVIERDVVVKFAVAKIEVQNRPAAAAAERCRSGTKPLFPLVESTEIRGDCLLDTSRRFAVAAQVAEILLVKDRRVRCN